MALPQSENAFYAQYMAIARKISIALSLRPRCYAGHFSSIAVE